MAISALIVVSELESDSTRPSYEAFGSAAQPAAIAIRMASNTKPSLGRMFLVTDNPFAWAERYVLIRTHP